MSEKPNIASLKAALERYVDPYLAEGLGAAGAVREVSLSGTACHARIVLGFPVGGYREELEAALREHLRGEGMELAVQIELEADIRAHAVQRHLQPLGEIKNIVAVASGKGRHP
jgi:ATP-binding protein involved in chromosome partitioning